MAKIFNIDKIEKKSGLRKNRISRIEKDVKKEFPHDELMYELHLMRAIEYYASIAKKTNKEI